MQIKIKINNSSTNEKELQVKITSLEKISKLAINI